MEKVDVYKRQTFLWFFNPLYRKGQSEELVQHTLSLDDQLMYAVNPELYLSGVGSVSYTHLDVYKRQVRRL